MNPRRFFFAILFSALVIFLAAAGSSFAAPGDLDSTFGSGGIVTTYISGSGSGQSVALQSDGKIVVAGNYYISTASTDGFAIARYTTDGALDPTFGKGGIVTYGDGWYDYTQSVLIQPNGQIVVVGYSKVSSSKSHFTLLRFNANGTPDPAFGPLGEVTTSIGSGLDQAFAAALQSDGCILVGGLTTTNGFTHFAIVRYTTSGALDTTFGSGGIVTTAFGPYSFDSIQSIAVQSNGAIVAAGTSSNNVALARYTPTGALDTTFGTGGTTVISSSQGGQCMALQSNGAIVVGGTTFNQFSLVRCTSTGALDNTFGTNGLVTETVANYGDTGTCIAIEPSGKILLGGRSYSGSASQVFTLLCFNTDGSADTTFGTNGVVTTPISTGTGILEDSPQGISVQNDGKIVAAGFSSAQGFAVVRYLGAPLPQITTSAPSGLTTTTATVNGTVNPNGQTTTAQFQYGLTTAYGNTATVTLSPIDGTSAQNVSASLAGLTPGATYHYSLTATNSAGTTNGFDQTFSTVSTNANLAALALSSGALSPAFSGATLAYNAGVSFSTSAISVTPTVAQASATVTVNGQATASGAASSLIALNPGPNAIPIVVTAQDGVTTQTYTLTVTRSDTPVAGDLDFTLGSGGIAPQPLTLGFNRVVLYFGIPPVVSSGLSGSNQTQCLAVQSNGQLLLAGSAPHNPSLGGFINTQNVDFALVRCNPDGSPDTTFGTGGMVTTDFGATDEANGVAVQSDGKILVVGVSISLSNSLALARYNTDGSPDTTFGVGGIVTATVSSSLSGNSLALQSDGKIVVAGTSYDGTNYHPTLARFNTDGSLDSAFGSAGFVIFNFGGNYDLGFSVAVQSNGQILLGGTHCQYGSLGSSVTASFALARVNTDGSADATFGTGGQLTTTLRGKDFGQALTLQTDGKILFTGTAMTTSSSVPAFALVRYNADGSLDSTYGSGGSVFTAIGYNAGANSLTLQSDGKCVVAGSSNASQLAPDAFAVARYNTDGSLDTTFGAGGVATTQISSANDFGLSVAQQPNGAIVLAGSYNNQSGLTLVRYLGGPASPPPAVVTGSATSIATTSANLGGTVDPDGVPATAQFEYGLTTAYGNTASAFLSPNNGLTPQPVGALITGLASGTVYHYRLSATTAGGTIHGADQIFTTLSTDATLSSLSLSAGVLTPNFDPGATSYTASVSFGVTSVSVLPTANQASARVSVNGVAVPPTTSSDLINLYVGVNTLTITVLAQDGVTTQTYTVAITRSLPGAGDLDLTFGSGGIVSTFPFNSTYSAAVAIQPDGRILLCGGGNTGSGSQEIFALRCNTDGSFDSTFGSGGSVLTTFPAYTSAAGLALQSDGNIVIAGGYSGSASTFAVLRFTSTGVPDPTFGSGGASFGNFGGNGTGSFSAVALQSDGKIVGAASLSPGDGSTQILLARFTSPGVLDTTFGNGGVVNTPYGAGGYGSVAAAQGVAIQSDGKIVVAGYTSSSCLVARYNTDGSLDTTFGSGGIATPAGGTSFAQGAGIVLQSNGQILVAGTIDNANAAVWRLNTDGSSDTAFGAGGVATANLGSWGATGQALALQSDGKILVTGSVSGDSYWNQALFRFNTDGSPDTSFGGGSGGVATSFGAGATGQSVAVEADGGIIVAGSAYGSESMCVRLTRYLGGPTQTGPAVVTGAGANVTPTSLTLTGAVNPQGASTTAWFEYGATTAYGTVIPLSLSPTNGATAQSLTAALSGLPQGATIHYRLVAANALMTVTGGDQTLATLSQFQQWQQAWFGVTTNTGSAADIACPCHDGVPNLMKFACNLDPTKSCQVPGQLTATSNGGSGPQLTFTYTRSLAAVTEGILYTVEWSNTLSPATWSNAGVSEQILSQDANIQQVQATIPVSPGTPCFAHLKVTRP